MKYLGKITDDKDLVTKEYVDDSIPDTSTFMVKGVDYVTAGKKADTTLGTKATAEGNNNTVSGNYSHAEGNTNVVSGASAHVEGGNNTASGIAAHAEGGGTGSYSGNTASGIASHAEGGYGTASGDYSHSEGGSNIASGIYSHAQGYGTRANHKSQFTFGEFNIIDTSVNAATDRGDYIEIVGNGTSNSLRSNARTLDWSGNEVLAGKLTIGTAPTADMDVATKKYVDDNQTVVDSAISSSSTNPVQNKVISERFDEVPMRVQFGTPTTIVDTTTLSFSKDGDNDWYTSVDNPLQGLTTDDFQFNVLYKVTWDGDEYELFCMLYGRNERIGTTNYSHSFLGIGSAEFFGTSTGYDTTAPFCLVSGEFHEGNNSINIITSSTEVSHTIKIERTPFTVTTVPYPYYNDISTIQHSLLSNGTNGGAVVVGVGGIASGLMSMVAGGSSNIASGNYSHAEGLSTIASASYSHSEGINSTASGVASHAEGITTTASGEKSHAEGQKTTASGKYAHSEGNQTIASGNSSHTEGQYSQSTAVMAHAEGDTTYSKGRSSHTENSYNLTASDYSHVEGGGHIINATQPAIHVFGTNSNVPTTAGNKTIVISRTDVDGVVDGTTRSFTSGQYIEVVGNGLSTSARSNARTLDWDGNEVLAGSITVGNSATMQYNSTDKSIDFVFI